MALIGLFCGQEEVRRELTLAIEEHGHRVVYAGAMAEALEMIGAAKPQLMVAAAELSERTAESFVAEAGRLDPSLPVVVALPRRDAARAVELMKSGACEVVTPPWTRENLSACLAKALRFKGTVLEVIQPIEKARNTFFYFVTVAVFFGIALGYAVLERRHRMSEQVPPSQWELPYAHPSGMAYDGKRLWITDWYSQSVYIHDPATIAVRKAVFIPTETPIAITFGGDALWTVSASGQISKHMLDDRMTVLSKIPDLFPHTIALAYDGLYLWTLNNKERVLRKHLVDEKLTVLSSYFYTGNKPAALVFDGKYLWSVDSGNRELLKHDMEDPRRILLRIPLPEYQSGLWRSTGLVWDGARFWTVAESASQGERPGRVFRHSFPRLAKEAP